MRRVNSRRHGAWLVAAAAFAAFGLPVLVYYTGVATLGPYSRGGLGDFLRDFLADLARLRPAAWVLLLGPVVMVAAWRAVVAIGWPRRRP
jgi:hypothetical protein